MATRLPTQDELIGRALDTEEGNITEHRDYLRLEEEKRAKARVVKKSIEGPVLRWASKKETIQVEVHLPPPPPMMTTNANLYAAKHSFVYTSGAGGGTVGSQAYSIPFYAYTPLAAQNAAAKPQEMGTSTSVAGTVSSNGNSGVPVAGPSTSLVAQSTSSLPSTSSANLQDSTKPVTGATYPAPSAPSLQQQSQPQPQTHPQPQAPAQPPTLAQTQTPPSSVLFSYPPVPTAPLIAHRIEDVCKNYVIHELSQSVPSKPPWKDTMSAMFGDHVQWDEVKVFTGKGRPLGGYFPCFLPPVSFVGVLRVIFLRVSGTG